MMNRTIHFLVRRQVDAALSEEGSGIRLDLLTNRGSA